MLDLITITSSAWLVLQPYLPIIATKAAEEIGKKVPEAAGKLWAAISGKFNTKAAAKEALQDLLKAPDNTDLQAAFRVQLKKLLEEDTAFAEKVQGLVAASKGQTTVNVIGDGAAAVGDHAVALGKNAVMHTGDVKGDFIVGGKKTGK